MDKPYFFDGYHHRSARLLQECEWHLRFPSAANAMPVDWEAHRLNLIKRLEQYQLEFKQECESQSTGEQP